jgi:hypothetical protein
MDSLLLGIACTHRDYEQRVNHCGSDEFAASDISARLQFFIQFSCTSPGNHFVESGFLVPASDTHGFPGAGFVAWPVP